MDKTTNILVIVTGGTIGSVNHGNVIHVKEDQSKVLEQMYREKYGDAVHFDYMSPYQILSENLEPSYWLKLIQCIRNADLTRYDGLIVTHGSDTLSYTSALLGMIFWHLPLPIVLTASNRPLKHPESNGFSNFSSAVALIRSGLLKGVFTVYQNDQGENRVYLPARLLEADSYTDQFHSFGGGCLGRIVEDTFVLDTDKKNPGLEKINDKSSTVKVYPSSFDHDVLLIKPYPGLDYERINLSRKPSMVLHTLYHSATACTKGGIHSFLSFSGRCQDKDIPVYAASFHRVEDLYETSKEFMSAGVIPLFHISFEAAYVKMLIASNQDQMQAKDYIQKNVCYEYLP